MALQRLHGVQSAFNSIAHWVFAIQYFKVALNFPIIVDLFQPNINKKLKATSCAILSLNAFFYTQLLLWMVLVFTIDFTASDYSLIFDV